MQILPQTVVRDLSCFLIFLSFCLVIKHPHKKIFDHSNIHRLHESRPLLFLTFICSLKVPLTMRVSFLSVMFLFIYWMVCGCLESLSLLWLCSLRNADEPVGSLHIMGVRPGHVWEEGKSGLIPWFYLDRQLLSCNSKGDHSITSPTFPMIYSMILVFNIFLFC